MGAALDRALLFLDTISEGGEWRSHAPLLASIQDLSAAQAAWKPSPQRKSIWEIVNHVAFWTEYYVSRMGGEPPRPSGWYKDVQWPGIPEATEEAWQATIRRLKDAIRAFRAEIAQRFDEQLDQPLPGRQAPLYAYAQVDGTHRCYHCGQIMYLRALQGLPPLESVE